MEGLSVRGLMEEHAAERKATHLDPRAVHALEQRWETRQRDVEKSRALLGG